MHKDLLVLSACAGGGGGGGGDIGSVATFFPSTSNGSNLVSVIGACIVFSLGAVNKHPNCIKMKFEGDLTSIMVTRDFYL